MVVFLNFNWQHISVCICKNLSFFNQINKNRYLKDSLYYVIVIIVFYFYWIISPFHMIHSSLFFFLRFYLFIHRDTLERERSRDTDRERSRLHAGSPIWDLILGFQGHALGLKVVLKHWATRAAPIHSCLRESTRGAQGWLSQLSICLPLRTWPQGPGMEPGIRFPLNRLLLPFPLPLPCLMLSPMRSLSLFISNK